MQSTISYLVATCQGGAGHRASRCLEPTPWPLRLVFCDSEIPTANEVKPENLLLYAGQEAEKKQQVATSSFAARVELVYHARHRSSS